MDSNSMSEQELLQAQVRAYTDSYISIKPMSIKCALDLGIPEIIHSLGKPMTLSDLVSALPINPERAPYVGRLMRLLVFYGFFGQRKISEDDDGYVLTETSRFLLMDNPFSGRAFFNMNVDPDMIKPRLCLASWFKNDDNPTPYYTAHGKAIFDFENNVLNDAMASDSRLAASVVISKCKSVFEGFKTFVDVGGGTGSFAKAIAKAFPNLECMVFELPHVIANLNDNNIKFIGGDMFEAVHPADLVLLKLVLHDWNNEECIRILKRCKDACNKGGKVIIIDIVMTKNRTDIEGLYELQLLFDLEMMTAVKGQERTEEEWAKLFLDVGFTSYKIHPILGARSLIEVFP